MFTDLPVIEPIAVPDTFVSGVLDVENLGDDLFRITSYAIQNCPEGKCAVVVSRHVMSGFAMRERAATLTREVRASRLVTLHTH